MGITQGGSASWGINRFYVEEPIGAEAPSEIIPLNGNFDVKVEFDGNGGAWTALENASAPYEVKFYAEGVGLGAKEIDFGVETGSLAPGGGPYTVSHTVLNGIDTEGVYRLGCLIKISPPSGMIGFEENLLVSVA